ncbi:hypothetical protein B0H17DRAFT_1123998 [Mycena rosella]|uniref:MYND-type domain-containing protein n=1 Tax=Mycena rosella TaxID=1033263 RepID=A0AAD7H3G0_MYCRO|nr:hypothetical protein B0H17DRAFT_1123998 [Mycena rosella]
MKTRLVWINYSVPINYLPASTSKAYLIPNFLGFIRTLLLPVFFSKLNPAKIPSATDMDTDELGETSVSNVLGAYFSLTALDGFERIPPESFVHLWQRAWPWMEFWDVYCAQICPAFIPGLRPRFTRLLAALLSEDTVDEMVSTSGVRVLVTQAWAALLPSEGVSLRAVSMLFSRKEFHKSHFQEFIEGAGGIGALTALISQHSKYLVGDQTMDISLTLQFLDGFWHFAESADLSVVTWHTWMDNLCSNRYIGAVMSVLLFPGDRWGGTDTLFQLSPRLFKLYLTFLTRLLVHSAESNSGSEAMREALMYGLLRVLVLQARRRDDAVDALMRTLVGQILPARTIYLDVLFELDFSLRRVAAMAPTHTFTMSAISEEWRNFIALLNDRLGVKKQWSTGEYVRRKACDNMECGKIDTKNFFRRCSGCKYQHYCSRACQITDWRAGHREVCQDMCPLTGPRHLTPCDRSFLRALITHDYEQYRLPIFATRIVRMRQYPGRPLQIIFDYTGAQLNPIDVQPIPTPIPAPLQAYISRATRSGNRMHLCAVHVGSQGPIWMLPIRSSSSKIADALAEMAREIPLCSNASELPSDVLQKIRELIWEGSEVIEIV